MEVAISEEMLGVPGRTTLTLSLAQSRITLADLILQKVATEVSQAQIEETAETIKDRFAHPVAEKLNEALLGRKRTQELPDPEQLGYKALAAFQRNAFFVIVDGKQREELEEELVLTETSTISFIRLTPLVGG